MPQKYIKRKTKPAATYGETGEENKIQWITKSVGTFTGGGGEAATVDTEMSDTSTNAVQNKVIKEYVDTADENLTKVMPTDIAVKDNNKIILKHDGEELTGQTNPVEFKTINEQSLLGAGNINIDAGSTVILEAGMEVTTELVEKLKKASQVFYRFTREYNESTTIYKLPCEVAIYGANDIEEQGIILTVIWNGINPTDGVALEGVVTSFNARFTSRLLVIDKSTRVEIPELFFFYSADSGLVYLNVEWDVKVLSGVQILNFENNFTGLDLEIIAESSTVYATIMDEEVGTTLISTPVQATPSLLGGVTSVTLMSKTLSSYNQFNYIDIEVGKNFQEVIGAAKSFDFVIKSQLKTINNESLVADGGGNISIPTVQIEILEEGDN